MFLVKPAQNWWELLEEQEEDIFVSEHLFDVWIDYQIKSVDLPNVSLVCFGAQEFEEVLLRRLLNSYETTDPEQNYPDTSLFPCFHHAAFDVPS